MSKELRKDARRVARKGRRGDTHLLHVSSEELARLASTGHLTTNPETGLPEAFSLGGFIKGALDPAGLFTKQGSSNPLATLTANVVNPGGIFGGGVTPATVQQSLRVNPFGPKMSYFDVLGGGAFAGNADVRKYGRMTGTALAAYFGGSALMGELGGGGTAAGLGTTAAPTETAAVGTSTDTLGLAASTPASDFAPYSLSTAGTGAGTTGAATDFLPYSLSTAGTGAVGADAGLGTTVGGVPIEQPAAPVSGVTLPAYTGSSMFPSFSNLATYLTGSPGVGNFFGGSGVTTASGFGSMWDVGQGLYGMEQAQKLRQQASQADPFAPYRAQYAAQLAQLSSDPGAYLTKLPGYEAGIQAVNRGMAAGGYLGSGNQMVALQKYGGDIYNQEATRLANLAGANISPQIGLQGQIAATELAGQAMGSIGYGAMRYLLS